MYFYRCTEQQLNDALQQIHESGDTLHSAIYKGGRDWVLICLKAPLEPSPVVTQLAALGDRLVEIRRDTASLADLINSAATNGQKRARA